MEPADKIREANADAWSPRTPFGAAWRGTAVLAFAVVAIAASAWITSKLIPYDDRLASAALPAVLVVGALVNVWLRARNVFLVVIAIGGAFGAPAGAYLIRGGYVSADSPHVAIPDNQATFLVSMLAIGAATVLVAIIWGTVSGYRHPRPKAGSKQQA